mgnify:CR=1 FL=1
MSYQHTYQQFINILSTILLTDLLFFNKSVRVKKTLEILINKGFTSVFTIHVTDLLKNRKTIKRAIYIIYLYNLHYIHTYIYTPKKIDLFYSYKKNLIFLILRPF